MLIVIIILSVIIVFLLALMYVLRCDLRDYKELAHEYSLNIQKLRNRFETQMQTEDKILSQSKTLVKDNILLQEQIKTLQERIDKCISELQNI